MLHWIIIAVAAMVVFGLFLAVMALKEKREAARPPVHTCANRAGCQCGRANAPAKRQSKPSP